MRRLLTCACLLAVLTPPVSAAGTGTITGTVDKPDQVTAVTAVDRTSSAKDIKYPGKIDPKTGKFSVENLPLDRTYDVVLDLAGGVRLEGVNLKVPRSDYEEEQPLSKEDVEAIKKITQSLDKFADQIDVLAVSGNIQHAAVMVNKLRTKPFYDSKPGQIVWRLELWHFERPDESWVKVQDEQFIVFYRERIQRTEYDKKALTLDPALGGVQLGAKQPAADLGAVKLPSREPGVRLRAEKTEKAEAPRAGDGR